MANRALSTRLFAQTRRLCAVLATLFFSALAVPSLTTAQDLYAIDTIMVDETAASEVEAKDIGIAKAKQEAFTQLINRLTEVGMAGAVDEQGPIEEPTSEPAPAPALPDGAVVTPAPQPITMPDPERLEFLIRDMAIANERFGGGRYLADVSVRFQANEVNRFLQRSQAAYLSSPSPRAVILPLFADATGAVMLWDETNPWLDAWLRTDGRRPVVPYTVPLGDLSDIGAIDAARLVAVDAAAINAIAARHRAGAVVIPLASLDPTGNIEVEITTYGTGWPAEPERLRLMARELTPLAGALYEEDTSVSGTELGPQLHAAAIEITKLLDRRWKAANMLRFDEEATSLVARAPLTGLNDWLSVRSSLDSISAITEWRLAELNTDYAMVSINYVGDEVRLSQAFARLNLSLLADPEASEDDLDAPRLLMRR